jgi:hypothetical protein
VRQRAFIAMAIHRMIRQAGLWLMRVALALVAALSCFTWLSLLGSKPLSVLPPSQEQVEIPDSAKSFRMDHGQIRFSLLGTPKEEPIRFGILVSVSVAAMLGLILSFKES